MICADLEERLRDLAAGTEAPDGEAAAHLATCADCRARLDEERRLSARLRAYAEGPVAPLPPALEKSLRAAYRREHAPAPRRGRGLRPSVLGAGAALLAMAAAALLVAGGLSLRRASTVTAPTVAHAPAERAALPLGGRPPGAFVSLGIRGAPVEYGRVARVGLPTSVAAYFGWPVLPDLPEGQVLADVLIGEDGQARALRFLPASYTPRRPSEETQP